MDLPPPPRRRRVPWPDKPWRTVRSDVLDAVTSGKLAKHGQFDAIFCDPPYGLATSAGRGFMGLAWDRGVPSARVWSALGTLLRPGAPVLAFGGTRMFHRLMVAMEDGGLEMRDCFSIDGYQDESMPRWYKGGGWPKPGNVSKYIDDKFSVLAPELQENERFSGYHANLKPAWEPVVLMRKPLDGTLAENALFHGVAGLNIDGCRIGDESRINHITGMSRRSAYGARTTGAVTSVAGRWPSNVILTCDEAICGPGDPRTIEHQPGCHVSELDRQSGGYGGDRPSVKALRGDKVENNASSVYGQHAPYRTTAHKGEGTTASRFFYCAKVSKSERGVSAHPCMKPVKLCKYIARLLLPPPREDGHPRRILIPYSGSGSEMIGALAAGWDEVVGVEWDDDSDNPNHWANVADERILKWFVEFTHNLRLANKLRDACHLTRADFKDAGVLPSKWVNDGLVVKVEDTWVRNGRLPGDDMNRRTIDFYLK